MSCKNCRKPLSEGDNYCNQCGAKVINNRLTVKSILSEFYYSFFNIDSNKPVRTFVDLIVRPEEVIGGYINGTRKKYIHAFGYFTIVLTITSLYYFILLKFFPEVLDSTFSFQNNELDKQAGINFQKAFLEYQSLMFFVFIPALALMSWIVFKNKKKYNYAEHLVINLYGYSQAQIISIFLLAITAWNIDAFAFTNIAILFIQIIYFAYMLKRIFNLSIVQTLLKTLYFFLLFIPAYIIIIIIAFGIMYTNGSFDELIEAEKAKHAVSYMVSSFTNWTS